MSAKEEILKLTKLWMEIVCLDHHKDRDCHWSISETWSYGDKPYWEVSHYGYVFAERSIKCKTYEEAQEKLIAVIKEAFAYQVDWAELVMKDPKEWDSDQIKIAEIIIKKLKPELEKKNWKRLILQN